MNLSKLTLPVITALLIIINIWVMLEFSTLVSDYLRFGNMLMFFAVFNIF